MTASAVLQNSVSTIKRPALLIAFSALITAFWLMVSAGPSLSQSAGEAAAMRQVQALLTSAQQAGSRSSSKSAQVQAIRSVVRRHFAVGTWANALLGRQKSKFSGSQQSEFRRLLPGYLAKLYVNQFGGRSVRAGEVTGASTRRGDVLVTSRLPRGSGGGNLTVVWRTRVIGGKPRVIDYSVGGVSNVVLKRSEFTSKVRQSGPASLNSFLRSFIAA
ncbi:MAG: ABC transporter substrate-binding protein [Pseudomonadota bacterium]